MPAGQTATPPVVTVVALYGTAISRIGPRIAERLGVPFLDHAIVTGVAERLGVPEESIESYDPDVEKSPRSRLRRFLDTLGEPTTADPSAGPDHGARRLRAATADYLAEATVRGGVCVGRGAMVVLQGVPGALHVRLDGPREARVEQAMRMFGIDARTAERRRRENDRLRIGYVRETYGVDLDDPDLYHLRVDSTVLDWETCVGLVVEAARAHCEGAARAPRPGTDAQQGTPA
jgi:hypothetical protein